MVMSQAVAKMTPPYWVTGAGVLGCAERPRRGGRATQDR
jgi:hypothetical protein